MVKYKKQASLFAFELLIVAAIIAFDLITKHFIYGSIKESGQDIIIIDGIIRFTAVENTGASFGIFQDRTSLLAIFSAVSALVLISFQGYTINNRNKWLRAALILIIAGAIGNLYDRFAFEFVRDFVYFELINFAVFNFADSSLVIGCIVFSVYVLFFYNEEKGFADKKKTNEVIAQGNQTINAETENNDTAKENSEDPELDKPQEDNNTVLLETSEEEKK